MGKVLKSHLGDHYDALPIKITSVCEYCSMCNNGASGCDANIRQSALDIASGAIGSIQHEEKNPIGAFLDFCENKCPYRPQCAS